MTHALRFDAVTFAHRAGEPRIFERFDLTIGQGEMTAILGPNGTGKTTLLRLAAGSLKPSAGRIELFGDDLAGLGPRERARRTAVVPQETHLVFDFSAREVVGMGRSPHLGLLGLETLRDAEALRLAMERTEVSHLADRPFRTLSGGERQGVVIARALAQDPRLMLLDEPTAFLDLKHQLAIYDLLRRLNRETGSTVVVATHDVNLAARHCGRLVLLQRGRVLATGAPSEVLRPEPLLAAYGVETRICEDPETGLPWVLPVSARQA